MSLDAMGGKPVSGNGQESVRELLGQRLKEIQKEIAPDYQIPAQLWDQMMIALERGSPASGGAFSKEELEAFDDDTRARLGDFLAEATRAMRPDAHGMVMDSQGNVIGGAKDMEEARRRIDEERHA